LRKGSVIAESIGGHFFCARDSHRVFRFACIDGDFVNVVTNGRDNVKRRKADRRKLYRYQMSAEHIENTERAISCASTSCASTRSTITIAALLGMLILGFAALRPVDAIAQAQPPQGNEAGSLELVDAHVFRACGDPRNMPFSNDKSEGFENKLAELFAAKLGKKLSYTYFPQATGFVRMTLGSYRCDVIMGFPQGDDQAQVTIPYYRTTYALITKRGSGLEDVTTINDPRLKDKRIGIVAKTPPSTNMAMNGLLGRAKSYPLFIDTRADSSAQAMIDDLNQGNIDCGILWGPMAGYFAAKADPPLVVVPLVKETAGPPLMYRIGMAVRPADQEWKRTLNKLIAENQTEINKLLISYNIPILDGSNAPITSETLSKRP
jgi:quinoprotein dehydrogenase-associated probable ABC transporter substrate-binding protein